MLIKLPFYTGVYINPAHIVGVVPSQEGGSSSELVLAAGAHRLLFAQTPREVAQAINDAITFPLGTVRLK